MVQITHILIFFLLQYSLNIMQQASNSTYILCVQNILNISTGDLCVYDVKMYKRFVLSQDS
jgi:hypothetical protein